MTIHLDQGIHRHLEFSHNGSSIFQFHITTWPKYLAISGDMGSFVFTRTEDMFQFFRHDKINPSYWAEKCEAGKTEEWSQESFMEAIDSYEPDEDTRESANWCDGEVESLAWLNDHSEDFPDIWEFSMTDYTYHYIWCCEAIRWAIEQYDLLDSEASKINP